MTESKNIGSCSERGQISLRGGVGTVIPRNINRPVPFEKPVLDMSENTHHFLLENNSYAHKTDPFLCIAGYCYTRSGGLFVNDTIGGTSHHPICSASRS